MRNRSKIYSIIRPIVTWFSKTFLTPKVIGIENIPKSGRVVLAGNHTSIMDPVLLISLTKRQIHFLAKKELFDGIFGWFFKSLGLVSVDRSIHDVSALKNAIEYLNMDELVLVFPEGTTEKGKGLLEFKTGAVRMANETNSKIVPFIIKGKYKLFSKHLSIEFLKPISISDDIKKENIRLRNLIKEKLED